MTPFSGPKNRWIAVALSFPQGRAILAVDHAAKNL